MKADRDCFDPARRSTRTKRSFDSVIEVFSFILLLYYFRLCFSLPLVGTNSPRPGRQPQSILNRLTENVGIMMRPDEHLSACIFNVGLLICKEVRSE